MPKKITHKEYVLFVIMPEFDAKRIRVNVHASMLDDNGNGASKRIFVQLEKCLDDSNLVSRFIEHLNLAGIRVFDNPEDYRFDIHVDKVMVNSKGYDYNTHMRIINLYTGLIESIHNKA